MVVLRPFLVAFFFFFFSFFVSLLCGLEGFAGF